MRTLLEPKDAVLEVPFEVASKAPFECMFCPTVFAPDPADLQFPSPGSGCTWLFAVCPHCGTKTGLTKERHKRAVARLRIEVGATEQQSPSQQYEPSIILGDAIYGVKNAEP